jgi:hypothetical protein
MRLEFRRVRALAVAVVSALGVTLLPAASQAFAAGAGNGNDDAVHFVGTMSFGTSGPSNDFDISWVDNATGQYFLADATHGAVAQFDATTNTFVRFLGQGLFAPEAGVSSCLAFTGGNSHQCHGPNGVVTDDAGRVWAGNSPTPTDPQSSIVAISLSGPTAAKVINVGGHARADELSFDPQDGMILIANDVDGFLTWISTKTMSVVGHFYYSGNADGVPATVANHPASGGLEQSVYDPQTGLFYQSVPGFGIDVFRPVPTGGVGQLVTTFATPDCTGGTVGLVLAAHETLVGGCGNGAVVVKVHDGATRTVIPNVGSADEIWYNPGDRNLYFGRFDLTTSPITFSFSVADGQHDTFIQTFSFGTSLVHSVAAYSANNEIFVPVGGVGVEIFQSG